MASFKHYILWLCVFLCLWSNCSGQQPHFLQFYYNRPNYLGNVQGVSMPNSFYFYPHSIDAERYFPTGRGDVLQTEEVMLAGTYDVITHGRSPALTKPHIENLGKSSVTEVTLDDDHPKLNDINFMKELLRSLPQKNEGDYEPFSEHIGNLKGQHVPNIPEAGGGENEFIHLYPVEQGKYIDVDLRGKSRPILDAENHGIQNSVSAPTQVYSMLQEPLSHGNVDVKTSTLRNEDPVFNVRQPDLIMNPKPEAPSQKSMEKIPQIFSEEYSTAMPTTFSTPFQFDDNNSFLTVHYYPFGDIEQIIYPEKLEPKAFIREIQSNKKTTSQNNVFISDDSLTTPNYHPPTFSSHATPENPLYFSQEQPQTLSPVTQKQISKTRPIPTSLFFQFPSFTEAKKLKRRRRPRLPTSTSLAPENLKQDESVAEVDVNIKPTTFHPDSAHPKEYLTDPTKNLDDIKNVTNNPNDGHTSISSPASQPLNVRNIGVQVTQENNYYSRPWPLLESHHELPKESVPKRRKYNTSKWLRNVGDRGLNQLQEPVFRRDRKIKNVSAANKPFVDEIPNDGPMKVKGKELILDPATNFSTDLSEPRPVIITRVTSSFRAVQHIPSEDQKGGKGSRRIPPGGFNRNRIKQPKSGLYRWRVWSRLQLQKVAAYLHRISRRFHDSIGIFKARKILRKHPLYRKVARRKRKSKAQGGVRRK